MKLFQQIGGQRGDSPAILHLRADVARAPGGDNAQMATATLVRIILAD